VAELLWLGLFMSAIGCGWWLGSRERMPRLQRRGALAISYNYLLDDQPDAALQRLVDVLEVNDETFEAHLGVGRQFRQRGELAKATQVHQNLLARPELGRLQQERAQLELANDFLAAGVLSRAEPLLQNLVDSDAAVTPQALRGLLRLYEQEREWGRAIDIGQRLAQSDPAGWVATAHYHCELAEQWLRRNDPQPARSRLEQALQADPACVRASLILARLAWQQERRNDAIRHLLQVHEQDAGLFAEALPQLLQYASAPGDRERLEGYLRSALEQAGDSRVDPLVLALAEVVRERHGVEAALEVLRQRLAGQPSLRIIQRLLEWQGDAGSRDLDLLRAAVGSLLGNAPAYCCRHCGFQARQLYWQCPACHGWSSIRRQTRPGQP